LESVIRSLKIHSLKRQVESSRLYCKKLASQFDAAASNADRTRIAHCYDEALKHTHTLQLLLELLEREQRKAGAGSALEAGTQAFRQDSC